MYYIAHGLWPETLTISKKSNSTGISSNFLHHTETCIQTYIIKCRTSILLHFKALLKSLDNTLLRLD